jgi:hydrogenase assembly chaperone HypC/HupF
MCLGFPGRVVAVDAAGAVVDVEGRRRRASTLLVPDVGPGDWVFVTAGTIVDRIDPAEAAAIRSTLLEAIARMDEIETPGTTARAATDDKEDRR